MLCRRGMVAFAIAGLARCRKVCVVGRTGGRSFGGRRQLLHYRSTARIIVWMGTLAATASTALPYPNYLADVGLSFTGTTIYDSGFIPPDTMGAVGPNHIVELVNGRYRVYDKSTGSVIADSSLDSFWTSAGASPTNYAFDPRVTYDPDSGRWFAVSVDNAGDPNSFLLAVSKSSDPTEGWTAFKIDSDSDDSHWADFPTLGVDADGVYICANMFDAPGGAANPTTVTIVAIPKDDLVAANPTVSNATKFENLDRSDVGWSIQPAVSGEPSDLTEPLLAVDADYFSLLNRTNIEWSDSTPSLSATTDIPVASTSFPPDANQPGTKADIETNDDRFSSYVYSIDGTLWAVHSISYNGRAAIRWYQIDESTNTVLQWGTIYDDSLDLYYPSIAVNEYGHVIVGCSGSSETQYVSAYAFFGETNNGSTTFSDPILLVGGVSDYERLDSADRNRWGDYSTTVVDPSDPLKFWTFQEYVYGTDAWATRITMLQVEAVPEPATVALFGLGVAAGVAWRRRRSARRDD